MIAQFPPKVAGEPRGIRSEAVNAVSISEVAISEVAISAISEAVNAVISPEGANLIM